MHFCIPIANLDTKYTHTHQPHMILIIRHCALAWLGQRSQQRNPGLANKDVANCAQKTNLDFLWFYLSIRFLLNLNNFTALLQSS